MWIPQNIVKPGAGAGAAAAAKPNVTFFRMDDVLVFPARDSKGVKTLGDIVMKPGAQMFNVYMTPSKQVKSFTTEGDEDQETVKQKFEGWSPGDGLELSEYIQNNLGVDMGILADNCTDGVKRLYGTPCAPMKLKAEQTDDSSGRGITLTYEQAVGSKYVPAHYVGNVTFGAPYAAADADLNLLKVNGAQYLLPADAAGAVVDVIAIDLDHGTFVTLIGSGGATPSTLVNGATSSAEATVALKAGTTWTALKDATITFMVFNDGTDTYLIEQSRS